MAWPWAVPLRPRARPKRKDAKYMYPPPPPPLFLGSACLHRQHGSNPPFSPTSLMPAHPSYPTSSCFVPHSPNLPTPEHYVVRSLWHNNSPRHKLEGNSKKPATKTTHLSYYTKAIKLKMDLITSRLMQCVLTQ